MLILNVHVFVAGTLETDQSLLVLQARSVSPSLSPCIWFSCKTTCNHFLSGDTAGWSKNALHQECHLNNTVTRRIGLQHEASRIEASHNYSNLKCSGETKREKNRKSTQRSLWFCLSLHLFSIQMHQFDKVLTTVGCCLHSMMNMKAIGWVSVA